MTPGRVPEAEGVDVIHPWEVVGVLIALCGASAYTGFRYARDLAQADAPAEGERADDAREATSDLENAAVARGRVVPIKEPPPGPTAPAAQTPTKRSGRVAREVEDGQFIDLHERLGPWGRRPSEPHSDADAEDDRGRAVAETDAPAATPRAGSDR